MVYKFFDKKSSGPNYQLGNEFHREIIKKFKRGKVYLSFRDNIWGCWFSWCAITEQYNKGIKYSLCAIGLSGKHPWVVPLKDKREISIVNAFQKVVSKGRKPNKIWVDQGDEFCNNFFKKFLEINNI